MDLNNVDLNLLVTFDVLMRERSVTRAAARLYVTQSAISAALARLRRLLNDPILVRQGRQFVPTAVAEELVLPIREILNAVELALSRRQHFDPLSDKRTFSIVASDYATVLLLQPLMKIILDSAPNIKIRIRPLNEEFVNQLNELDTDMLIIPKEAFSDYIDYPSESLFTDRYLCAVDKDHNKIRSEITMNDFCSLPYLAMTNGKTPGLADLQLDRLGIERNTEITGGGFTIAYFLLKGSNLFSLVHERFALKVADQLNLRLLEPPVALDTFTECMVWTARNTDDPGHRWLRQQLLDLATTLFGSDRNSPYTRPRSITRG